MKRHLPALVPGLTCLWLAAVSAQQPVVPAPVRTAADRITTDQVKADLDFLASDALKGRNTPSPGFDAAAEYIEKRLQKAGVKPLGDNGTYRQHYVMREATLTAAEASVSIGDRSFGHGDGFTLRGFAGDLTTKPLRAVYVGHGFTTDGVDPYRGIDVKGKLVVVHGFSARPKGAAIRQLGRVWIGGSPPIAAAYERGALAVVFLHSTEPAPGSGPGGGRGAAPRPVTRKELVPGVPSAYAAPLLTSIQLGEQATRAMLEGTSLDASRLEEQTKAQTYPDAFELPAAVTVRLPAVTVDHRPYNIVGLVEGAEPAMKDEHLVIQSHLDGAVGTREVEGDSVYNSADDNATGSAVNISLAEQMMAVRPKRSIVFVWDSGEEQGLWGTRRFVSAPPVPLTSIVTMINIDMIGANRAPGSADAAEPRVTGPNEVFLIGPRALSDRIDALLDRVNADYQKLTLNRQYDTPDSEFFYPRTDAGPYLERGVLTVGFTTGIHPRYHLPADEARHLDPAKAAAIGRTVFVMAHALAASDARPKIDKAIPETVLRTR